MVSNSIPACVPTMTLFTRDIIAKTAESVIKVVSIPEEAKIFAVSCPVYLISNVKSSIQGFKMTYKGPDSTTITSNFRFSAAFFKNSSTVFDLPYVIIISFA